jgi:hypothetical protein
MKENTAIDMATIEELRAEIERLNAQAAARDELHRLSLLPAGEPLPTLRAIAGSARQCTAPRGRLTLVKRSGGVA